jgi:energy-coupling factor transporter transmembrane protein EcfT
MHLADIDYLAFQGGSFWHKASALSKLLFTLVIIGVVVISKELYLLAFTWALLLLLLFLAGVPLRRFIHLLLYPALFASIFALSSTGNWWVRAALVLVKSLTAATAVLLLITTTGVPAIFGCLRLFLPALIADALFMTYRSFFMLLGQLNNFATALRLKGGYNPLKIMFNLHNAAAALGVLLIHSLEASERMHRVLALRGYRQGIIYGGKWYCPARYDLGPVLATAAVLLGAVLG